MQALKVSNICKHGLIHLIVPAVYDIFCCIGLGANNLKHRVFVKGKIISSMNLVRFLLGFLKDENLCKCHKLSFKLLFHNQMFLCTTVNRFYRH